MSIELDESIDKLSHVGPRNMSRLKRLGIKNIRDLLWYIPSRYEDYSEVSLISQILPDQKVNIQGEIVNINTKRIFPRRMTITTAVVRDESGAIKVVWFNRVYIKNQLPVGTWVSLAGKAKVIKGELQLSSPIYERLSGDLRHTSGLVPVYPETEGITSKYLRFLIKPLMDSTKDIVDPVPEDILTRLNLINLGQAIENLHYPQSLESATQAKRRIAFDDLLSLQLKSLLERRKMNQLKSVSINFDQELIKSFIEHLPFELTKDQKVSAWEILKDIQKTYPMNRLMEGDVGSGKTVVALIAAYQVAKNAYQTVFMAPTEVLAHQHFKTITSLLDQHTPTNIALLTSSAAKFNWDEIKKSELKKKIASGNVDILIGTHALIQKDVKFSKLALVILDEQHRFGVEQRANLVKNKELVPHLLSMTATPIPRTLALTIYGDLDISIIKEKPKHQQKIITKIILPSERLGAYKFIENQINQGRQVFVVCPRIEPSEKKEATLASSKTRQLKMDNIWAEVKAVQEEYEKLSKEIFPQLKVGMLHGKLKAKEKTEIMERFKNKEIDLLVSTSVIEVGVDVPNATVMMIESADRFGLAQLHQFRGRVGRGEHQSYCLLFTSSSERTENQRLKALVDSDNGFELAEKDMFLRGPGEFFGVKQSGLPDLAMASLADIELIKQARAEARNILKEDPSLKKHPLLRENIERLQKMTHFE